MYFTSLSVNCLKGKLTWLHFAVLQKGPFPPFSIWTAEKGKGTLNRLIEERRNLSSALEFASSLVWKLVFVAYKVTLCRNVKDRCLLWPWPRWEFEVGDWSSVSEVVWNLTSLPVLLALIEARMEWRSCHFTTHNIALQSSSFCLMYFKQLNTFSINFTAFHLSLNRSQWEKYLGGYEQQ